MMGGRGGLFSGGIFSLTKREVLSLRATGVPTFILSQLQESIFFNCTVQYLPMQVYSGSLFYIDCWRFSALLKGHTAFDWQIMKLAFYEETVEKLKTQRLYIHRPVKHITCLNTYDVK